MLPKKKRTRSAMETRLCGTPAEMSQSQLPSKRDVVRHFYVFSDQDVINKPNTSKHCKTLAGIVLGIWQRANPNIPTYSEKSLINKVNRLVTAAKEINTRYKIPTKKKARGNPVLKDEASLDTLFDISKCICPLEEAICSHPSVLCRTPDCSQQHFSCVCKEKIPAEDRFYLKDQRERIGSAGKFQMGSVDPRFRGGASASGAAASSSTPATASSTDTESG